jgi:hypothetical protein
MGVSRRCLREGATAHQWFYAEYPATNIRFDESPLARISTAAGSLFNAAIVWVACDQISKDASHSDLDGAPSTRDLQKQKAGAKPASHDFF